MDRAAFLIYQDAIRRAELELAGGAYSRAFDSFLSLLASRLAPTCAGRPVLANAADILVTERLAQLALLFGHAQAADCLLDAVVTTACAAGNHYLADYTTLQRVHIALADGRARTANALLGTLAPGIGDFDRIAFSAAGLAAWEAEYGWLHMDARGRLVLLASFYLACGRLFAGEGLYVAALASLARGVVHCGLDAPDLARRMRQPLRLAEAACRVEQGELAAARALLAAAEPDIDPARQPALRIRLLELRSKLALLGGDYGTALRGLEGVLAITRGGGFHAATMTATINLAHVLTIVNQTAAAAALLEETRTTALARGDAAGAVRIAVLLRLGQLRGQSLAQETAIAPSVTEMREGQDEPDAAPLFEDADPELLPQEAGFLAFFETRALAVHWHLGQRRPARARAALDAIRRTFGATDSALVLLRMDVLDGMLDHYGGDWNAAVPRLESARARAAALGLDGEMREILRRLAAARAGQGAPAVALRELAAGADRLLQAQAASLEGAERALYLLNKWTADEEALLLAVHELQELARAAASVGRMRRLLLRTRIRERLRRLVRRIDHHKALLATQVLEPATSRPGTGYVAVLRKGGLVGWRSATLAFLVLPDRTVTIRASGFSLDFSVAAVTRLRLRELVGHWYTALDADGGEQLSRALGLHAVLAGLPPRVTALRIVPDDILHGVPFAALRCGDRYWIERYALAVDVESAAPRTAAAMADGAVLLAGVSRACGRFHPLPKVREELPAVAATLASAAPPLFDADASRAALLALWPRAALVHIACHGEFMPDRPDGSGLVLMPVRGAFEILTLRDLARLDLHAVRHVTLSSCWGADNFIAPGRWVISLPETLLRAGCGSVLAALWQVDDRGATEFMTCFYTHLKTQRRDRALQSAQLACLAAGGAAADPAAWAGFVLYGSGGRLKVRPRANPTFPQGEAT